MSKRKNVAMIQYSSSDEATSSEEEQVPSRNATNSGGQSINVSTESSHEGSQSSYGSTPVRRSKKRKAILLPDVRLIVSQSQESKDLVICDSSYDSRYIHDLSDPSAGVRDIEG
uniref:Uncharacterized protein n=1 Tax=Ditylenchus dipsaci TaxID=166011 RepID=A0A915CZL3_9BILA